MLRMLPLLLFAGTAAAHTNFTFPTGNAGCPMAHCSNFAGGQDPLAPPSSTPILKAHDAPPTPGEIGESPGLGCVSNGNLVACTYKTGPAMCGSGGGDPGDLLVIYSYSA